jgi:hypothetical protein
MTSSRTTAWASALLALTILLGCREATVSQLGGGVVVSVSPRAAAVAPLGTQGFVASVTGTTTTSVTWSVVEAGGGSVTAGLYTAPGSAGLFHVQATSVADTNRSGLATVTVTAPPPTISPNPASVALGATQQFVVSPSVAVTWAVTQTGGGTPPTPVYPLMVASGGRYLVDQSFMPWRIQADSAWFLSSNATPAQVDAYLANRKAKGFNSFYLMAMVPPGGYGAADSFWSSKGFATGGSYNYKGDKPFTTTNNFLTPNETYWAWIDTIIDKAAAQGIAVMFWYNYLGYAGGAQGWASVVSGMTQANATAWGTWLGNRYKGKANVIWGSCGDFTPPPGSQLETNVVATINAIRAAGATQPWVTELSNPNTVPSIDDPTIGNLLETNAYYGYGPSGHYEVYWDADRAYRASTKPVWAQETGYEYENNTGSAPSNTQYLCRRTRFWNSLAGGTAGDGFGSANVWQLNWSNLATSLDSPGSVQSGIAFQFLATLPWWDLRPSGTGPGYAGKTLITAGAGTWGGGSVNTVVSALSTDQRVLVAYVPGSNNGSAALSVTVDMTAMAGATRARWWNPFSGASTDIATGLTNTGARVFTTPGPNGDGNDWVLVLDIPGAGSCGVISATGLYTAPAAAPDAGVVCQVIATVQANPSVVARATVTLH